MEKLLTSMGSFLTHSKKDDNTTELPKFHGGDAQWPQWYHVWHQTPKIVFHDSYWLKPKDPEFGRKSTRV